MKKSQAKPQIRGNRARITVVVPVSTFEALASAPGDRTWRQLAQDAVNDLAATIQKETPAGTEPANA